MRNGKLKVALAGLGFGGAFVPIWCMHPDVYAVDIIEPNQAKLEEYLRLRPGLPVNRCWKNYEDALADGSIDAVHLVTPIPLHARQSIAALRAGKHCACTVPMGTSLEDLAEIVKAEKESGRNYMMMETAVYTYQCIKIAAMVSRGEFGQIQMLRGCHYQDMENWPPYWAGLPPMWYGTHAIAPLLWLTGTRAEKVCCFGSGVMRDELTKQYANPYPAETALFRLKDHPAAMEVTRTLFHTVRVYCEGFAIYGEKASFEWLTPDYLYTKTNPEHINYHKVASHEPFPIEFPDTGKLLPAEIGRFTKPGQFNDENPQNTFVTGGGHHGSHPHLVHEFARSIIENRPAKISGVIAADWTAAGICAHESAMRGGECVSIPDFRNG